MTDTLIQGAPAQVAPAYTTEDFNYELPAELIAQEPAAVRDACKLLVMDRETGAVEDHIFADIIDFLQPGDVLVANDTRVRPARLFGNKRGGGAHAEIFLLREVLQPVRANNEAVWEALVRPGKRLKPGAVVDIFDEAGNVALSAEVLAGEERERTVRLTTQLPSLDEALHAVGNTPLPPYIKNYTGDKEMYQTVYSRREGSAAAPTAGLHFTPELIARLQEKGVLWETVELQVGLDTFRVVDEDDPTAHVMHTETYTVPEQVRAACEAAHARGNKVIAVGTTSVRSLESATWPCGWWSPERVDAYYKQGMREGAVELRAVDAEPTSLYIMPGYKFNVVDGIITNFHVPKSTLLMLISAFAGRDKVMAAYEHAIEERYRFFSFGDAMFLR